MINMVSETEGKYSLHDKYDTTSTNTTVNSSFNQFGSGINISQNINQSLNRSNLINVIPLIPSHPPLQFQPPHLRSTQAAQISQLIKNQIFPEIMQAVKEAHKKSFQSSSESPCMNILLKIKKDYLLKTGQINELNMLNNITTNVNTAITNNNNIIIQTPILTKVKSTTSNVPKILQKKSLDYALSMGRSFRVGWGPNGEFVHSGKIYDSVETGGVEASSIRGVSSSVGGGGVSVSTGGGSSVGSGIVNTYSSCHRVVIEKINTIKYDNTAVSSNIMMKNSCLDCIESSLKSLLNHSFVFHNRSNSTNNDINNISNNNMNNNINTNINSTTFINTITTAPLWRAPYAKPWDLGEYIPYLNVLESLQISFDSSNSSNNSSFSPNSSGGIASSNSSRSPDFLILKAIELISAISGQEVGSYITAKSLYSSMKNTDKLNTDNASNIGDSGGGGSSGGGGYSQELISMELEKCRESTDLMPLYEEREGYFPVDWERRREGISQWLMHITAVEGWY